jgi:hypothetical protein
MTRLPDRQLLNYLAACDPHISNLALALRDVVLEEAPDAIESISKGYAVVIGFSFTGKPLKDGFCHVVTYSSHVNHGFNRGALLPNLNRSSAGYGQIDSPYHDPQGERTGPSVCEAVSSSSHRADRSAKGWLPDGRRLVHDRIEESSQSLGNNRQDVRDLARRGRSYQISCQHMVY